MPSAPSSNTCDRRNLERFEDRQALLRRDESGPVADIATRPGSKPQAPEREKNSARTKKAQEVDLGYVVSELNDKSP